MDVRILSEIDVQGGHGTDPLVRWRVVFYMVGDQGPFLLEGPADELTPERVRHELADQARRIHALIPPTGP